MFGSTHRAWLARCAGAAIAAGLPAQAARADLAFHFTGGYDATVGTQTNTVGNDGLFFTIESPITVSTLGYYHDGAVHTNTVGLFRVSDGELLASANITTTSAPLPDGSFDMASIAPITLEADTRYAVVGLMAPGQVAQYVTQATPVNAGAASEIAFNGYMYNYDSSLSLPSTGYDAAYVGPNFGYTAVPATGSASLMSAGSLFMLKRRRR